MEYVEAPDIWLGTIRPYTQISLFLAGGITNCPDWQREVRHHDAWIPRADKHVVVLNPRRENFPMGDPIAGKNQIYWEGLHLQAADVIMFWFPEETLCPITLLELGAMLSTSKPLFIGTHPNYERRYDVIHQTAMKRPGIKVYDNLDSLAYDTITAVISGEMHRWIPAIGSSPAPKGS